LVLKFSLMVNWATTGLTTNSKIAIGSKINDCLGGNCSALLFSMSNYSDNVF
jgi:hypothetical protein